MPDLSETLGIATYRKSESRIVIRLNGPLDNANASRLMDELAEADPYVRDLVELDLEDVTSIDSTGIGALIYAEAFVRARHTGFSVSNSNRSVIAAFELAGLDHPDRTSDTAPGDDPSRCARPHPHREIQGRSAVTADELTLDGDDPAARRLDISCHQNAHGINLDVAGEIDSYSASILTAALERAVTDTDGRILVDLAAVTFIDSSGITALVAAQSAARGRLQLEMISPPVRRILDITGLTDQFPCPEGLAVVEGSPS